jgi:hypothetical protein
MQRIIAALIIILSSVHLSAQEFGGNPPSTKWQQINTDTARIIFQQGRDSQANRVASIIHYLAANKPVSLGEKLKKINIVLQDQTIIPNGYVQLGPYLSEFFLTPDMNNFSQGSIPWADQLAIHEYRHVQQYNNFDRGASHLMHILFGEEGYALAVNASIPDWFYEGDAVYNETVLTRQGRGRIPLFLNAYPALWQAGKKYSWMKMRNGSFKDYVPSHYDLGYLMVNYGREKYGMDFWSNVTQDAAAFKGLFYPWQKAIKKYAGIDYKTFYTQALNEYKKKVTRESSSRDEYVFPVNKNYVTGYYFPYQAGIDSLVYLKASYRHRPAFYVKDNTGNHKIKTRDISIDEQFSYRNGKIVYSSYENHPRWRWKDYSVIKVLDIKTGAQYKLANKTRYFTPDISADGKMIAAVQVAENGRSELHVMDAVTGKVLSSIHASEINLFTDPKFIDSNNLVTAVRLQDGKMALATAEISTGITMRLTPPSFNVVGYPCYNNGVIWFTASYGGNDDVFALRLKDQKIFKITNGPLGNYYVNAANGKVTWSVFTAEGYQLKQVNEKDITWTEVSVAQKEKLTEKFPVAGPSQLSSVLTGIPERHFGMSKYSKATNLFNFHSWRPYYEDPIFTFSLYGENVLNTFQTELYYLYNQNEKTSSVGFSAVYGGFFPYLNFGTEYTFNREDFYDDIHLRHWDQLDTRIGFSIPLQKTSGQTFKNFSFGSSYVLRNEFNKGFFKDSVGNTSFSYLQHSISWNQQVQRTVQQYYPRFAYFLAGAYRHAITEYKGWQFNAGGSLFIPGILTNHNIQFSASFQERDTLGNISFGNRFAYSRGYTGLYFSRMYKLSANYHMPLVYPDWGFANILYLQRLRTNLFYDYAKVFSRNKKVTVNQQSIGAEFFLDTKWWNQYPLTFGFRVTQLLDHDLYNGFKGTVFELVLPVNILPR